MKCGKCSKNHETVSEVRFCYGLPPVDREPDRGRDGKESWIGPTQKQWDFYRSLADQIGRHVHDRDRDLFSMEKISDLIDEMLKEVKSRPPKQVAKVAKSDVPAGHYAIKSLTGNNDLDFFRIDRPAEGRWAGYIFIKRVIGGKPDVPVKGRTKEILAAIESAGVQVSAELYGRSIGRCYRCNRHLTDEISRAMGIGPQCRDQDA